MCIYIYIIKKHSKHVLCKQKLLLWMWLITIYRLITHTHTHTHVGFYGLRGLSIGVMVFILYKLYVLLPYTYPTPKLSPHRRRCISIFPQKNSLCMIYKRFKLWGHWKCPHKSPSPCNTGHTHVIIQICVLINHINMRTHTHTHTHTHIYIFTLTIYVYTVYLHK